MKDIQTWLGHSNFAFTANTYVHSSKDSHIQMAQAFSENLPELGLLDIDTNRTSDFPETSAAI